MAQDALSFAATRKDLLSSVRKAGVPVAGSGSVASPAPATHKRIRDKRTPVQKDMMQTPSTKTPDAKFMKADTSPSSTKKNLFDGHLLRKNTILIIMHLKP